MSQRLDSLQTFRVCQGQAGDQDSGDTAVASFSPPFFRRMLEYSLDGHNVSLSAVRTVRVLRPLRAINRVPSEFILVSLRSGKHFRCASTQPVCLSSSDFKLNSGCLVKVLTFILREFMFA